MVLRVVVFVALAIICAEARPRYIAIPLQDVRLVRHARSAPVYELAPQRNRRQTYSQPRYQQYQASEKAPVYARARLQPAYEEELLTDASDRYEKAPIYVRARPQPTYEEELLTEASDRYERQNGGYGGGNDHVDYGAYTGGYGAFGWYTDHPVCVNCGHHH